RFKVQCGKGTYIRSLVHDMGKALNSGAYLTALVRDGIGEYKLSEAWTLDHCVKFIRQNGMRKENEKAVKPEN
ncbi:MAG: hypothetical protein L3J12_09665, partial [Spirochaetales bacterium]|nr:hypothetical protein [Spirochaetales bacterium]